MTRITDIETKISPTEYTCAHCGETYEKGWTDEEAAAEKTQNWGEISMDHCAVICDDCYQKFMGWYKNAERTA